MGAEPWRDFREDGTAVCELSFGADGLERKIIVDNPQIIVSKIGKKAEKDGKQDSDGKND